MTTLTPAFVHYFPSRNAATDPYSCFVYMTAEMTATLGGGAPAYFTAACPKKGPHLVFHNDPFKRPDRKDAYLGRFRFKPVDPVAGDHVRELTVYRWDIDIRDSAGAAVPVLTIQHVNRLFKGTLKRNLLLYASAGVTVSPRPTKDAPAPAPAPAPAVATTATDVSGNSAPAIVHVAPPKLKAKKSAAVAAAAVAPSPTGDLRLFVAKQLLELAQLKKDMCPITAEEYYTGETAVMPCGHLFMRIAIEESFKKEPGSCPACRQRGRPTYV